MAFLRRKCWWRNQLEDIKDLRAGAVDRKQLKARLTGSVKSFLDEAEEIVKRLHAAEEEVNIMQHLRSNADVPDARPASKDAWLLDEHRDFWQVIRKQCGRELNKGIAKLDGKVCHYAGDGLTNHLGKEDTPQAACGQCLGNLISKLKILCLRTWPLKACTIATLICVYAVFKELAAWTFLQRISL